jgi:hypothetical protein
VQGRIRSPFLVTIASLASSNQRSCNDDKPASPRTTCDAGPDEAERSILTEEVKIGCTLGVLQCLDRPHRLAYVLGQILEFPAPEAAQALDLEPAVFRKDCNAPEMPWRRSRAPIVASCPTLHHVGVTGASRSGYLSGTKPRRRDPQRCTPARLKA